jgi:hypothetical protein
MKKFFSIILIIVISLTAMLLPACSGFFIDSDNDIATVNMKKLILQMQNQNREGIKALFAPNAIADIDDFDKSIDELLSYYNGDYVSGVGGYPDVYDSKDGNKIIKRLNISEDVTTTECTYRFAVEWYVKYTTDKNNVGIWNFYIIKYEDDPYQDYYYWGDGYNTAGINIGKIFDEANSCATRILNALNNRNVDDIKFCLSQNMTVTQTNIDDEINELLSYYIGDYIDREKIGFEESTTKNSDGKIIQRYVNSSFKVATSSCSYYIAFRWCDRDNNDIYNTCLWSLYVIKADEYNSDEPYWGDGLWTNGINIGITKE